MEAHVNATHERLAKDSLRGSTLLAAYDADETNGVLITMTRHDARCLQEACEHRSALIQHVQHGTGSEAALRALRETNVDKSSIEMALPGAQAAVLSLAEIDQSQTWVTQTEMFGQLRHVIEMGTRRRAELQNYPPYPCHHAVKSDRRFTDSDVRYASIPGSGRVGYIPSQSDLEPGGADYDSDVDFDTYDSLSEVVQQQRINPYGTNRAASQQRGSCKQAAAQPTATTTHELPLTWATTQTFTFTPKPMAANEVSMSKMQKKWMNVTLGACKIRSMITTANELSDSQAKRYRSAKSQTNTMRAMGPAAVLLICEVTDCDAGAQQQWDQKTIHDVSSAVETGLRAVNEMKSAITAEDAVYARSLINALKYYNTKLCRPDTGTKTAVTDDVGYELNDQTRAMLPKCMQGKWKHHSCADDGGVATERASVQAAHVTGGTAKRKSNIVFGDETS
jgi:hypothetical protein